MKKFLLQLLGTLLLAILGAMASGNLTININTGSPSKVEPQLRSFRSGCPSEQYRTPCLSEPRP